MALNYFTLVHVMISLIGIASGYGMLAGMLSGKILPRWTAIFLITTFATSVSGFFFPFQGVTPAIIVGILTTLLLAVAIYAYPRRSSPTWCRRFITCSAISLYFNTFVLIAQIFQKIPVIKALAPTQSEPPFAITQLLLLLIFIPLTLTARHRAENTSSS